MSELGKPLEFERLGLIAAPGLDGLPGTHLQTPMPLLLPDRIRVFASTRVDGLSRAVYVDVERRPPFKVIGWSRSEIFGLGELGAFDDEGAMPAFCMPDPAISGRLLMLYSGWNARRRSRYHNATGLAESFDDGETWRRVYRGPIMDRTAEEPFLAVTPWVMKRPAGGFQAWYISGLSWTMIDGIAEPLYVIKSATSSDLAHWQRPSEQVVAPVIENECFSRPAVERIGPDLAMLFCSRSPFDYRGGKGSYRLGAAVSAAADAFIRSDVVLHGQTGDWEQTMQCYPAWLNLEGERYVFYNGDNFGATGFGVLKYIG